MGIERDLCIEELKLELNKIKCRINDLNIEQKKLLLKLNETENNIDLDNIEK